MSVEHLALLPREGYFFKDGRGWTLAGGAGRTDGHEWPYPSTLRGALRSAHGFERLPRGARRWSAHDWQTCTAGVCVSALLALRRRVGAAGWASQQRVWPAPADALMSAADTLLRLQPRAWPGVVGSLGRDDDEARERLAWPTLAEPPGKPHALPRWWCEADFAAWLAEQSLERLREQPRLPARLEIHLAIAPERQTAAESQLFTMRRTETLERAPRAWPRDPQAPPPPVYEWALAVRAQLPDDWAATRIPLGADRRPARAERVAAALFDPPEALRNAWTAAPCAGLRLVLATPGEFEGWRPPGFERVGHEYRGALPAMPGVEWRLRAACVPRTVSVSGWDMAAGHPKASRRLVPAGSVYFFTKASGAAVTWEEVAALWLASWGRGRDEGFGCVVPARWTPENGS
jgi:CRISPR-associated protein Cmr3